MRKLSKDKVTELLINCLTIPSESIESDTVEFKEYSSEKSIHNSKSLPEEISALANTYGGVLIIGVRDSSNVSDDNWGEQLVGIEGVDITELKERLSAKLKPRTDLFIEEINLNNKNYIVIHIQKGINSLISTSSGKYCIRDGRSSRPMEPNEIHEQVTNLQGYDWSADDVNVEIKDALDDDSLNSAYTHYCGQKGYAENDIPSKESFLEAIGATRNGILNKSGLLFLGKINVIKEWLGYFEYRYSWKTRSGNLKLNDVWEDNIWNSIKKVKKHFDQCNETGQIMFRDNVYDVHYLDSSAFHEGFMNAVVHRDYTCDGMIIVDYDSALLKIISPGKFYGGITSDNIATHTPRHRNKVLAKLLMQYQLVDRAGMGVKRMSIKSLAYGRAFPKFSELDDTVEVEMQAEAIRPGIFVLTQSNPDDYGISELVILNCLYEVGYVDVGYIEKILSGIFRDPWNTVLESINRMSHVELCGNNDGIFIKVNPVWNDYFKISKHFKSSPNSDKHVEVYRFLRQHVDASNEDVTNLLGYKHAQSTRRFLKDTTYIEKLGSGLNTIYKLKS